MAVRDSRWRRYAAPIIAACIKDHGNDEKALRKALREAYPFGKRKHHPYKIWCDEVAIQLGKKRSAFTKRSRPPYIGPLVFGHRPEGY